MMQVLEAHGKAPRRGRKWMIALGTLVLLAVAVGVAYELGKSTAAPGKASANTTTTLHHVVKPLSIRGSSPASGATAAASNADISITFSSPVVLGSMKPSLSPAVAGTWVQPSATTIRYDLAGPLIPDTNEVVTVPGGPSGVRAKDGASLPATSSFDFTVADGPTLRLQELLAELNFLPLSFTPSGAAQPPRDAAQSQYGTFAWRWPNPPPTLSALWTQGIETEMTKAAVMAFETQNDLTVDGLAGPEVWSTLLHDVAVQKVDSTAYVYVLVSKVLPENLTLYDNGAVQYSNIPVNTGAPGADTTDGTYAVFEHVTSSEMKGTNPNGTTYDDPNVPWASYFNGGDALHGFVRAQYGFPQSNGCVEMPVADAGMLWPYTPIGTLVTVVGPAS
jgi:lipoprotein-anchoring transpeptidase ErfK/SrfK